MLTHSLGPFYFSNVGRFLHIQQSVQKASWSISYRPGAPSLHSGVQGGVVFQSRGIRACRILYTDHSPFHLGLVRLQGPRIKQRGKEIGTREEGRGFKGVIVLFPRPLLTTELEFGILYKAELDTTSQGQASSRRKSSRVFCTASYTKRAG